MTISTNQKPTIYRNLYENTGPVVSLKYNTTKQSGCSINVAMGSNKEWKLYTTLVRITISYSLSIVIIIVDACEPEIVM